MAKRAVRQKKISLTSSQVQALAHQVDTLLAAGEIAEAGSKAVELFRSAPSQPGMLERAVLALRQAGNWPDLTELLLEARNRYQLWPVGSDLLVGQGLVEQGQHSQAIPFLEEALHHPDDEPWAHHFLGKALRAHGELEEALDHQRVATELLPDFAWAPFDAAEVLIALGKPQEAVLEVQEARRRVGAEANPVIEQVWEQLQPVVLLSQIDSLIERGHHDEALRLLRKAMIQDPENPELTRKLVRVLSSSQHQDSAENLSGLDLELRSIELLLDELEGQIGA